MWVRERRAVNCGLPTGVVRVSKSLGHTQIVIPVRMAAPYKKRRVKTVDVNYETNMRMALLIFREDEKGNRAAYYHPNGGIAIACGGILKRYDVTPGHYRATVDRHTGAMRINFDAPLSDPMSLRAGAH